MTGTPFARSVHANLLAALVALTLIVWLTLPWKPLAFAGLSVLIAVVFAALARAAGRSATRYVLAALSGLWVLSVLSNLYSAPAYNIRIDLAFFHLVALPLTVLVHGLVYLLQPRTPGR